MTTSSAPLASKDAMALEGREPTRIRSVERAARLLITVAALPEAERTARGIAHRLGTSLGTTYHLLNTLVDAKLLTRDGQRQYHLGFGIGALGDAYQRQMMPPCELVAPLRWLVGRTGESAYLSAWRHGEIEILAQVAGTHAVGVMGLSPGFHGVAHARASGKVLLAHATTAEREAYLASRPLERLTPATITERSRLLGELEEVAARGYALDEEEYCEGVGGISVPVLECGLVVGAYTITAPIERHRERLERYLDDLRAAARAAVALDQAVEAVAG